MTRSESISNYCLIILIGNHDNTIANEYKSLSLMNLVSQTLFLRFYIQVYLILEQQSWKCELPETLIRDVDESPYDVIDYI